MEKCKHDYISQSQLAFPAEGNSLGWPVPESDQVQILKFQLSPY